jgi:nitrogen fixation protein FixH
LVVPIPNLQEGQSITGWYMVGNVTSGGNTVSIDGDLRRLDAASGSTTDNSYATQTQFTSTANAKLSSANCGKGGSATFWGADRTGYLLVTATTGAACTITLQAVVFLIAG